MENETLIIKWAEDCLLSNDYTLAAEPVCIQKTPYSTVIRFSTSAGYIYLKQMPPQLSLEPIIIQILHDNFHTSVPVVIDTNPALNCFLMKDCGRPLREMLKDNFQLNLLCRGITKYTAIQHAVENDTDFFLKIGVPDWRLENLPTLYKQLINQESILKQNGLSLDELNTLYELHANFSTLCELLASYKIPETLDHCDFHDNNILINNAHMITIIDLGETVITHPFFSLITFLSNAGYRYALKETDPTFTELTDACFENWLVVATKDKLLEAMLLVKKLWPIYSALGYYRLMLGSNMNSKSAELNPFFNTGRNTGRLSKYFKEYIKTNVGLAANDTSGVNLTDPGRTNL